MTIVQLCSILSYRKKCKIDIIISNSDPEIKDAEALQLVNETSLKIPKELSPFDDSLSSSLRYELNIAKQTSGRGQVFQMLFTIPPTFVEVERAFSSLLQQNSKIYKSLIN